MKKIVHELKAEDFILDEWKDMSRFPQDDTVVEVRERVGGPIARAQWNAHLRIVEIISGPIVHMVEWRYII
jgi:hypothetical protein